jgi:lipopolysaccharide transport system ATP-binding protein
MSQPIITTENLSKYYNLGLQDKNFSSSFPGRDFTVRAAASKMIDSGRRWLRGERREANSGDSTFWALKDVSFEVQRGEAVGLIGRNGAGKSTLLKIFSRIVEPTAGIARLRGRVASLLEVGTGFHPDLSGRENIYLNGAILGMGKAEINRKFDEIVAFAEIEAFLDTPVKRYSSGMAVRLAFAVAAHLEPDILIVDEVLAVGDQAFQKKCLGKMNDVSTRDGRTVIFVSHNMGALAQLCETGVLLEHGQVKTIGPAKDVIQTYLRSSLDDNASQARFPADLAKPSQFISAEILNGNGTPGSEFSWDEPVTIRLHYKVHKQIDGLFLTLHLQNLEGIRVLFSDIRDTDTTASEHLTTGLHAFEIQIPPGLLAPSTYLLTVESASKLHGILDHQQACCEFTLRDLSTASTSRSGVLGVKVPWKWRDGKLFPISELL